MGALFAPTAPKDEIYDLTPNSFVAAWESFGGPSATKAQVRIVYPFSATIKETGDEVTLSPSVPSGSNIVVSWADSGLSTLAWGTVYAVEMRGYDGSAWSDWSPGTVFATNSAPRVPSNLSPSGGASRVGRPFLTCNCSDTGLEPVTGGSLDAYAVIMDSDGTVIATRPMGHVVGDAYGYQPTSADLPTPGDYRWASYSFDGHLYSGGTTVEANATRSPSVAFSWAAAPTVTIVTPANGSTLTSSTVHITWVTSNVQASARVRIFDTDTDELVYSEFQIAGNVKEWTVTNAPIVDDGNYLVQVTTVDIYGQLAIGTAAFDVDYTPATAITGVTATAVKLGYDAVASAVKIEWTKSTQTSDFAAYSILRTPVSASDGDPTGAPVVIGTVTDIDQEVWLDAEGASGQWYRYAVIQTLTNGQRSNPAYAPDRRVVFDGVVLGAVTDPEAFHVDFRYASRRGEEGELRSRPDVDYFLPLNASKPIAMAGQRDTWDPSGEYRLHGDSLATSSQRFAALRDLVSRKGTVCWRDGRGDVRYVFLDDVRVNYRAVLQYDVEIEATEIARDVEVAS